MDTTSQLRDLTLTEENIWYKEWINVGPNEWGGAGLDKDMVDINKNDINYIQSNPKLILPMDDLAVSDTGTTVHYTNLESPCNNKQQSFHLLPIQITHG